MRKLFNRVVFFCLLIILFSKNIFSISKDSLLIQIRTLPNDTNKATALIKLARILRANNVDSALIVYKKADSLSQKLNWINGNLNSLIGLANCYEKKADYKSSIEYCFKLVRLAEEHQKKDFIAVAYICLGIIFKNQEDYDKALEYHNKALQIDLSIKNKKRTATHYGNIGVVYNRLKDYDKAIEYYNKALEIEEEEKNLRGKSLHLGNMGVSYKNKKEYSKALECYNKALEINKELNISDGIITDLSNMGVLYTILKQYQDAEHCLNKSISLAKETNLRKSLFSSHDALSELYEKTGKHSLALKNYKIAMAYKDSLFNEDNQKALIQKEMQFNFDKQQAQEKLEQDKKDALAHEEQRLQRLIIYAVSGFAFLILTLTIVIFRNLKNSKERNKIIATQKEEVEYQKDVIEEKHKEITDSINYAERIQRSLLANKKVLDKNLGEYFVMFKPRNIVSGDFYWAANIGNSGRTVDLKGILQPSEIENFILVIADSTGHGVPGAIMSLLNITCLEKAIEKHQEPHLILNETREIIIDRLKNDGSVDGGQDGMDCGLMVFNKDKTKLSFAAANNVMFIIRPKVAKTTDESSPPHNTQFELIELKGDKMPVGKHQKQEESFTLQTVSLQRGDVIYALTDGFADQFGGNDGKKFMYKNLKSLLLSIAYLDLPQQHQALEKTFNEWKKDVEQVDDVTVIGIKI